MKPSRLFTFHLLCLTVSLTFLLTIAQADDKLQITKAQTQQSQSAHFIQFANDLLTVNPVRFQRGHYTPWAKNGTIFWTRFPCSHRGHSNRVKVKDASLKELLDEIARQSGLSVAGSGPLDERVTIEFHNLSLDEGIRLILRHHSFALD